MGEVGDGELDLEAVAAERAFGRQDGGVVEQRGERVVEFQYPAGALAHRFERRQVGDDEVVAGAAGQVGQRGEGFPAPVLVAADEDDAMPLGGEQARGGVADPTVRSGDGDGLHGISMLPCLNWRFGGIKGVSDR